MCTDSPSGVVSMRSPLRMIPQPFRFERRMSAATSPTSRETIHADGNEHVGLMLVGEVGSLHEPVATCDALRALLPLANHLGAMHLVAGHQLRTDSVLASLGPVEMAQPTQRVFTQQTRLVNWARPLSVSGVSER